VAVAVGVAVAVAVGVGEPDPPGTSAWKEVTVAVPLCVRNRMPQKPEGKVVSLAVTIQPLGSDPEAAQTLAVRVEPTTRKWMVYELPAVALNGTLARMVVTPLTFFCMNKLAPSINALYQLLPSVHRSTTPKLLLLKELREPVTYTSALEAVGPNTAL